MATIEQVEYNGLHNQPVLEVHKLTGSELGYPLIDFSDPEQTAEYIAWAENLLSRWPYVDHVVENGNKNYPYVFRDISDV